MAFHVGQATRFLATARPAGANREVPDGGADTSDIRAGGPKLGGDKPSGGLEALSDDRGFAPGKGFSEWETILTAER